MTEALIARGICKTYTDGDVRALIDVSVEIPTGQYVAITGPSGSGKSTLLHLLGALDRPDAGEVLIEGESVAAIADLDQLRSQRVGFVFQSFHLLPTLTAAENVQIPMFESTTPIAERTAKANRLLETVGLAHRRDHLPQKLSVGERQRVAIARALANDPAILLADEPTGNLDSNNAEEVLRLFDRLHEERKMTTVIVTHSPEVAARAQRVLVVRDGRIVADQLNRKQPSATPI